MYWSDLLSVLRRRWYVVGLGIVLTGLAVLFVRSSVAPAYHLTASVGVLPPAVPPEPAETAVEPATPVNVLAGLSLTSVASLLSHTLASDETARMLEERGVSGTFTALPTTDGTPLLVLTTEDPSADTARARLVALGEVAREQLRGLQADVPADYQLQVWDIIPISRPQPVWGSVIRAVVAVGGLGLVMTVLSAYVFDGLAVRRRRGQVRIVGTELGQSQEAHRHPIQWDAAARTAGSAQSVTRSVGSVPDTPAEAKGGRSAARHYAPEEPRRLPFVGRSRGKRIADPGEQLPSAGP